VTDNNTKERPQAGDMVSHCFSQNSLGILLSQSDSKRTEQVIVQVHWLLIKGSPSTTETRRVFRDVKYVSLIRRA
jgi:hypothetical protein